MPRSLAAAALTDHASGSVGLSCVYTSEMPDPQALYLARRHERQQEADRLSRLHGRIAHGRLAVFLLGVALLWPVFATAISWWWLAAPLAGFVGLALWHERVGLALRRALDAVRFYELGIARLEERWAGSGKPGLAFQDPEHPYAADLDLFGKGSLLELLCTCRTHIGERTLADWLLAPTDAATIRSRQEAVQELTPELDWRERLHLVGGQLAGAADTARLLEWGAEPAVLTLGWRRLLLDGVILLTVLALIGWSLELTPLGLVTLAALGQIVYVLWMAKAVQRVLGAVESRAAELAMLAGLLRELERREWSSSGLRTLRAKLGGGADSAAAAIGQLSEFIDKLAWRHNAMFLPIAALLLWGTRMAFRIDGWRQRHGTRLAGWLEAVGAFETLSAFANYAFEHPGEPFAEIVDGACFDGVGLKHPLMPRAKCVPNSVRLDAARPLLIVSGSNMSGKSTLLRVVGVQAAMALAGLPTPCERLRLSVLNLGATLRIQDSLQEGRSRFYAEILRLSQLLEKAQEAGPPLLFLLDEILHGTNSHDRRLGAAGVIKGLLDRGALGLVTTHDLALADLAKELGGKAENVHFADRLDGGTLEFDYAMRPGVVRHSNALALMRAVGLQV